MKKTALSVIGFSAAFLIGAGASFAQEFDANEEQLLGVYSGEYTGKTYSPYLDSIIAFALCSAEFCNTIGR